MPVTDKIPILMVAFHYPPYGLSSGTQRTLKFRKFLPKLGWSPLVLSAHSRAYGDAFRKTSQNDDASRAFALDTARTLAIKGRYPGLLAIPDRWVSWLPGAVSMGLQLIKERRPKVIWSTYPIATAHLIGYALHKLSGIPWVADLRDPMLDDVHPVGKLKRWTFRKIEQNVFKHAAKICCTTQGAVEMYRQRYPWVSEDKLVCIPNGFDDDDFVSGDVSDSRKESAKVTLLHSGTLYPVERDSSDFFSAIAELKRSGAIHASNLEIVLRATGHDQILMSQLIEAGIEDIVRLEGSIDYHAALAEMQSVDGLLIFQADNCNYQIPAKIYEYLRAGKPILAMTDAKGETGRLMAEVGAGDVVPLDDSQAIRQGLDDFVRKIRVNEFEALDREVVERYSRRAGAEKLARLLDEVVGL